MHEVQALQQDGSVDSEPVIPLTRIIWSTYLQPYREMDVDATFHPSHVLDFHEGSSLVNDFLDLRSYLHL